MNEPPRVSVWVLLALAFFAAVVVFDIAYGQHECQGGHNCNDGGEVIIDNVLTSDNAAEAIIGGSRGYAVSGSDMEIGDCLATHSIAFGVWQGTHTNPYCEALRMDAAGQHKAAAEMRCSTHKYKRTYGKGQKCIDAVIVTPTVIVPQTPKDDARIAALYARISEMEAQRAADTVKAEKAAQKANAAVVRAEQRPTVVNQYGMTEEQRQDLAKVFKQ